MAWYGELAPRILPRPSSAPAGDKPPHYIPLSPPLWIPAPYRGTGQALRRNDEVRFAGYRNGLGGLIVSNNCLSASENTLEVLNIKE